MIIEIPHRKRTELGIWAPGYRTFTSLQVDVQTSPSSFINPIPDLMLVCWYELRGANGLDGLGSSRIRMQYIRVHESDTGRSCG